MSIKLTKLSLTDIDIKYKNQLSIQDYSKKTIIEGVQIIELKNFSAEDGFFMELGKLDKTGTLLALPNFHVQQISFSKVIPGGVKAWHLHFNQEDLWFVSPDNHLLIGLVDLRKNSPTNGKTMRIVMGNQKSQLLLIPRGVAHGCANISNEPTTMIYFTNQQFNNTTPDEHRLSWDFFGTEFWSIKKG